jgi:hypothetical protein
MYTMRVSKQERVKVIPDLQADEVHPLRMMYLQAGYHVQIFKSKQAGKISKAHAERMKGVRIA